MPFRMNASQLSSCHSANLTRAHLNDPASPADMTSSHIIAFALACLAFATTNVIDVRAVTCFPGSCGPCYQNSTTACFHYECMNKLEPNGTCTVRSNVCACGLVYVDESVDTGKPACCGIGCPNNRTDPGKPQPPVCP